MALWFACISAWADMGKNLYFTSSDGVKMHYIEAGSGPLTLVFVPGWLMPARIFERQVTHLSRDYRVIVMDPRGQGLSRIGSQKIDAMSRVRDIEELMVHARVQDHVLVGWSLGVMEVLEYSVKYKSDRLRALVLIDNSIGMGQPVAASMNRANRPMQGDEFRTYVRQFAAGMFKSPAPSGLLEAIEESATQLPPKAAWGLLNKPYHRDFYKQAVLASPVPIWYAITPKFADQSVDLLRAHSRASSTLFDRAGHALFVDSADLFNQSLRHFLERLP